MLRAVAWSEKYSDKNEKGLFIVYILIAVRGWMMRWMVEVCRKTRKKVGKKICRKVWRCTRRYEGRQE